MRNEYFLTQLLNYICFVLHIMFSFWICLKRAPVKQNDMEHIDKWISFLLMFGKPSKRILEVRFPYVHDALHLTIQNKQGLSWASAIFECGLHYYDFAESPPSSVKYFPNSCLEHRHHNGGEGWW